MYREENTQSNSVDIYGFCEDNNNIIKVIKVHL